MTISIGTLVRGTDDESLRGIVVPCTEEAFRGGISVQFLGDEDWPNSVVTSGRSAVASHWEIVEPKSKIGRVVIMADMEGVSGVPNDETAVTPAEETGGMRTAAYSASCRSMTLDVQMAVAGARAAGAQEIIVADSHWHDTNLSDADFDVPVVRGSQAALRAMVGADAAMLIGWHARAGAQAACLPHTYTDRIKRLTIDGCEVGEIGMLARLAASHSTPLVFVSGDQAACAEVVDDIGCRTAVSKYFRNATGELVHVDRGEVWRSIVGQAYAAVSDLRVAGARTLPRHEPGQFEVTVHAGYEVDGNAEAERVRADTYRIKADTIIGAYGAFQRLVERLAAVRG